MSVEGILLHVLALGWGALCGAMIYEHLAVIPAWAGSPPASLTMWRGPYRLRAERFWMLIHPTLLVLLGTSLALTWSTPSTRDLLLVAAGGYALIIATTAIYYVPELMRLTRDPESTALTADDWRRRARRWEVLSLIRGVAVLGVAWPILRTLSSG